jgi:hypothetical protein
MVNWDFLFLTTFLAESKDGTFSHLEIVFDPQGNDRTDSGKGVSQNAENRLVAQPDDIAKIDRMISFWTSSVGGAGVFPSLRENLGVLTSRAGFIAKMPFSVNQENIIRMAAICCLMVAGEPACCSM